MCWPGAGNLRLNVVRSLKRSFAAARDPGTCRDFGPPAVNATSRACPQCSTRHSRCRGAHGRSQHGAPGIVHITETRRAVPNLPSATRAPRRAYDDRRMKTTSTPCAMASCRCHPQFSSGSASIAQGAAPRAAGTARRGRARRPTRAKRLFPIAGPDHGHAYARATNACRVSSRHRRRRHRSSSSTRSTPLRPSAAR